MTLRIEEERRTGQVIWGRARHRVRAPRNIEERTTGQVIVGSGRHLSRALSEMEDRVKEVLKELDAQVSHLDRERDCFLVWVEQWRQSFKEAEELLEKYSLTTEELKQKTLALSKREQENLKTEEASAAAPSPAQDLPLHDDKTEATTKLWAKIERIQKETETNSEIMAMIEEIEASSPGYRMNKMRYKMQRKEERAKRRIAELKARIEKEKKSSQEIDEEAAVRMNKMRAMMRRQQMCWS